MRRLNPTSRVWSPSARLRRRLWGALAGLALASLGAGVAVGLSPAPRPATGVTAQRPGVTRLLVEGRPFRVMQLSGLADGDRLDAARVAARIRASVPARIHARAGRVRLVFAADRRATTARVLRLGLGGGSVELAGRRIEAHVRAPVIAQALRNNCETAALSVLLATTGLRRPQLQLQARIARSGTLDPITVGGRRVWGDPREGFVGRAEGGGVAGGFGVYQRPVAALARREGRSLADLSDHPARDLYARLLQGHAVMVWIGLSNGPYGSWRSPSGRRVVVNFGEHAVVLVGRYENGDLAIINPLEGTRERWGRPRFEAAWALLGHRALSA